MPRYSVDAASLARALHAVVKAREVLNQTPRPECYQAYIDLLRTQTLLELMLERANVDVEVLCDPS